MILLPNLNAVLLYFSNHITLMSKLFFIFIIVFSIAGKAQSGKLLIVGGGSENRNAWSDAPYQWAIEKSENKKVAIISYDPGTDPSWLPEYFVL